MIIKITYFLHLQLGLLVVKTDAFTLGFVIIIVPLLKHSKDQRIKEFPFHLLRFLPLVNKCFVVVLPFFKFKQFLYFQIQNRL